MNDEHPNSENPETRAFEERLHRQEQAAPDPKWRKEILDASYAVFAESPQPRQSRSLRDWLREWLPMPLQVSLTAAWLMIAFLKVSTPHPDGTNRTADVAANQQAERPKARRAAGIQARSLALHWHRSIFDSELDFFFTEENQQ